MSEEVWRAIAGYEGLYEVSTAGRIRSLDRIVVTGGRRSRRKGVVLRGTTSGGYLQIRLCCDGVRTRRSIHHVVAEAFIGPRPPGMWVLHNDDNRLNNAASNLRYGTPRENSQDAILNGKNHFVALEECAKGHPFDELNTRYVRKGTGTRRECKACALARSRRRYALNAETLRDRKRIERAKHRDDARADAAERRAS